MQQGTNLETKDSASLPTGPQIYHSLGRMHNNDSILSRAYITLTSAQILALNATPITLIPAYGASTVIIVKRVTAKLNFNSVAYTGANNLETRYTDGSGAKAASDMTAAFINSAASAFYNAPDAAVLAVANAPIVVTVPTASPAAGNSTMSIEVEFAIRKLNG